MKKISKIFSGRKFQYVLVIVLFVAFIFLSVKGDNAAETDVVEQKDNSKQVSTFKFSDSVYINVLGKAEKTGVVTILAQTSGVISKVNYVEGQEIPMGENVVEIGSNYSGDNNFKISSKIAYVNYSNNKDNLQKNLDIIRLQKDVVWKADENTDNLNKINAKSIDETEELFTQNKRILDELQDYVNTLPETDETDVNLDSNLTALRLVSQTKSTVDNLKVSLEALRYSSDNNETLGQISDINRDIATKQLEIQEKALQLNVDISYLQLKIAKSNEQLSKPALSFNTNVERLFVNVGDFVNIGQPLAILKSEEVTSRVVVLVPKNIVENISILTESLINVEGVEYKVFPTYISSETDSTMLYSVVYNLPSQFTTSVADNQSVTVSIPVSFDQKIFVPIDSIFKTTNSTYVNVIEDDVVVTKEVEIGEVLGSVIEIVKGLETTDEIILSRSVIKGDRVKAVK